MLGKKIKHCHISQTFGKYVQYLIKKSGPAELIITAIHFFVFI